MRVDSTTYFSNLYATGSKQADSKPDPFSDLLAVEPADEETTAASDDGVDFTDMSRDNFMDWVNDKVKSGEIPLEDTIGLAALAIAGVDAGQSENYGSQKMDFLVTARQAMASAEAFGNWDAYDQLTQGYEIMLKYQLDT